MKYYIQQIRILVILHVRAVLLDCAVSGVTHTQQNKVMDSYLSILYRAYNSRDYSTKVHLYMDCLAVVANHFTPPMEAPPFHLPLICFCFFVLQQKLNLAHKGEEGGRTRLFTQGAQREKN